METVRKFWRSGAQKGNRFWRLVSGKRWALVRVGTTSRKVIAYYRSRKEAQDVSSEMNEFEMFAGCRQPDYKVEWI